MTVQELIDELSKLAAEVPGILNRELILSGDPEGNYFQPVACAELCKFDDKNWEIGLEELTPELEQRGYGPDDVMEHGKPALCLWP